MHIQHLSIDDLKLQAKALRRALVSQGHPISHGFALEALAQQNGYKDWNTLSAVAKKPESVPFRLGEAVRGTYLGQDFEGEIIGLRQMAKKDRFRLTIRFDVPVDVVKFEGMSNFRSRINIVVNREGVSDDKTSDGRPHLKLAS